MDNTSSEDTERPGDGSLLQDGLRPRRECGGGTPPDWKWRITELDGLTINHAVDPAPDKSCTGLILVDSP